MRTARLLLACALAACFVRAERDAAPRPPMFAWLAGDWRTGDGDVVCDEYWSEPRGGTQFGAFRLTQGDTTRLYELMTLERDGEDVVLRLRHFSKGLVPWKRERDGPTEWRLARHVDGEAVFENDDSRLTYRRADERTLVATLAPRGGSGKPQVFTYRRRG